MIFRIGLELVRNIPMSPSKITAIAHPNIAFIKYWGNRDDALRLPANGSLSMNLDRLNTTTSVEFIPNLNKDSLTINGSEITGPALNRVQAFLDLIREQAKSNLHAQVTSQNNFPTGAGIASSASAFAALALAASRALGLNLDEADLTRLARRGSGSACRSIPAGFVEWYAGETEKDSYAKSIAPVDHWELMDCIVLISSKHKATGSTEGHHIAGTSPLQSARVVDTPRRLDICRRAILEKDFNTFAEIVELDSNLMHAVMMTSTPPLFYWLPHSLELMTLVRTWRQEGLPVCYTLDAGANVHILCLSNAVDDVKSHLKQLNYIQRTIVARPGLGARLVET